MLTVDRPCLNLDASGALTYLTLRGPVASGTTLAAVAFAQKGSGGAAVYYKFAAAIAYRGVGSPDGFAVVELSYAGQTAPGPSDPTPAADGDLAVGVDSSVYQIPIDFTTP